MLLAAFLSSIAYGLVSDLGAAAPITKVATHRPVVGVLVDASARDAPALARQLQRAGIHVTFAMSSASPSAVDTVDDLGDDAIPQLNDSGLVGWRHTKRDLHQLERRLGVGHHVLYTSSGPSLLQVLLANSTGGRFLEGRVRLRKPGQLPRSFFKGEVIEVRINGTAATWQELKALERELRRRHLDPVPARTLVTTGEV